METLSMVWGLFSLLSMLGVPQLLGILAYFRIRTLHDLLAHVVGILIPPVFFFYLSGVMLSASAREIQSRGERVCGTYIGMMTIMILFCTGAHLLVSLVAQLGLHGRHRTKSAHV